MLYYPFQLSWEALQSSIISSFQPRRGLESEIQNSFAFAGRSRLELRQLNRTADFAPGMNGHGATGPAGSTEKFQRVSTFFPFTFAVRITVYIFGTNF